ncbi:MAG: hypothetical protein ABIS28_10125 [Caldimonas sp.]
MVALVMSSAPALADEIQIKVGDCKSGVELVARNAPLSKVLERLAEALSFQLENEGHGDRMITLNVSGRGSDVIAKLLSAQERFMVAHARDPRCPGQSRVSRLWLFSSGQGQGVGQGQPTAARKNQPSATKPVSKQTPVTEIGTPEQLRANEERSRLLKQDYDTYVRLHGKPPPGEEEEAARP